jgi:hypothetical protein
MLADQERFNQRVLDRARALLTPDQMLPFENAQKQWLDMQKFGIKFMQGATGQNAPSAPPAPPAR